MNNLTIRQENPVDHSRVFEVVEAAFREMKHADGDEQFLVERLRNSVDFIPELSLVAELDGLVVGHILFTRIWIFDGSARKESLSLAPVSVHPDFQNQGIGGKLILEGHRKASELGYRSVVVLGHEGYYPRFGYELCKKYDIVLPFDAPEENCMVIELTEGGLDGVSGIAEYGDAFF